MTKKDNINKGWPENWRLITTVKEFAVEVSKVGQRSN
jgi:hypothetical protein